MTTIDPKGISTIKTHDPFLRCVKEETLNPKRTVIAGWDKIYDANGNVAYWKEHVYEEGRYQSTQCTHFTYTSDNKIASSTRAFHTPDSRTMQYAYTPEGKVAAKMLPDGTVLSYAYDSLGFLRNLSSSDGKIRHRFECTKTGKLRCAFDEIEKIAINREIDPFGNVIREIFPTGIEMSKSYDPLDRLTTLRITTIGTISYTYDPMYLRKVDRFSSDGKLQYTHQYESYDLDGNLLSENMIHNCGKIQHHRDLKGRKTTIVSPYFSQKCLYDTSGNLIQNTIDQTNISHTYDDLAQLISENDTTYHYDSLFNRTGKDSKPFHVNRLNEYLDHFYDLNGNQVQKGDIHYVYDSLHRLKEASFGKKKVQFHYDPLGRRLTKRVMNQTSSGWVEAYCEHYLYDGHQEMGAITPDGILKNLKVPGLNAPEGLFTPVAIELNKKIFVPVTDMQGNICRLVEPLSKKITSRYAFTAFGEEISAHKDDNPWRWAAKRVDPELNLIYFGKRYYDPERGRWLTTDPVGFADSLNLYQYAFNNPYCYYDPNGEFLFLACIPFAVLFTPAVVKICIDAIAVGIGCWGLYKGVQYTADSVGSPYTLTEDTCRTLVNNIVDDRHDYTTTHRNTKKHREKDYPGGPKELEKNPDWRETTHSQDKSGSRTFENTKSGEKIRYDKGDPKGSGHEAHDHYHRYNPKAPKGRSGDRIRYLDSNGNPVPNGSGAAHLYPPEGVTWV